jgi:hypothetical protein
MRTIAAVLKTETLDSMCHNRNDFEDIVEVTASQDPHGLSSENEMPRNAAPILL